MKEDKRQKRKRIIKTILLIIVAIIGILYYSLSYGILHKWIEEAYPPCEIDHEYNNWDNHDGMNF